MKMGEGAKLDILITVSTGSLGLILRSLHGGLPYGFRICEIYGPESSGKTTLTLSVYCRSFRSKAKLCIY